MVMLDLSWMSDGHLQNLDKRCFSALRPSQNLDMCPNTHVPDDTTTRLRSQFDTFDKLTGFRRNSRLLKLLLSDQKMLRPGQLLSKCVPSSSPCCILGFQW